MCTGSYTKHLQVAFENTIGLLKKNNSGAASNSLISPFTNLSKNPVSIHLRKHRNWCQYYIQHQISILNG